MYNMRNKVNTNVTLTGFNFFPEIICVHQNSNYTDLKNKADHNDVSASLI